MELHFSSLYPRFRFAADHRIQIWV